MITYEQHIYEFFATEDNFRNMYKIAENYPMIKKQLLEDFWALVKKNIEILNERHGSKWIIQLTGGIELDRSKLILFKKGWAYEKGLPIVAIAFQRMGLANWPYYGMFLNNDILRYDHDAIRKYAQGLTVAKAYSTNEDNQWWPFWRNAGIDFSKPEEFTRILPATRNALADNFAETLFQLATDMETDMEVMANKMKK